MGKRTLQLEEPVPRNNEAEPGKTDAYFALVTEEVLLCAMKNLGLDHLSVDADFMRRNLIAVLKMIDPDQLANAKYPARATVAATQSQPLPALTSQEIAIVIDLARRLEEQRARIDAPYIQPAETVAAYCVRIAMSRVAVYLRTFSPALSHVVARQCREMIPAPGSNYRQGPTPEQGERERQDSERCDFRLGQL